MEYVCEICKDTHAMPSTEYHSEPWPCTACPIPCRQCASDGGRGAYCANTPCPCLRCHPREVERSRLRRASARLSEHLNSLEITIRGRHPIGADTAHGIVQEAIGIAMTIAAYELIGRGEK